MQISIRIFPVTSMATFALATVLCISGCKPQSDNHTAVVEDTAKALLMSSNTCFSATSNWQAQAAVNEYFAFELTLNKSCVAPEYIGTISVSAYMPAHGHGTNNQPVVKKISPYIYRIKGMLLHMPGLWRITVELPYTQYNQSQKQQRVEVITFNASV